MADQNKPAVLQAVKGMNDILPPESARWEWFENKVRALMQRYGYANVRTPIVEPTALFVRGLGEVTDIVEKEMYSFEDAMNGDKLTLRPEATAGIVRAMIEHNALYNAPLQAVKGMNDILPPASARWEWLESKLRALMARYGYANIRTPLVEDYIEKRFGAATAAH